MSDSSKRRSPFFGFSRKANVTPRGQKAIRSAIESLESRVLMSVTTVTYQVVTGQSYVGTVPTASSGTIVTDALIDAVQAADALPPLAVGNTYGVTIDVMIPGSGAATITPTAALALNNPNVSAWTVTAQSTGSTDEHPISISGSSFSGSSIFTVSNATSATFSNLTFINGNATTPVTDADGGAISSDVPSLTLTADTFTTDTASGSGGAVYDNAAGGTLTIGTSTFTTDTATTSAGAVYSNAAVNTLTTDNFTSDSSASAGAVQFDTNLATGTVLSANASTGAAIITLASTANLGSGELITISGASGDGNLDGTHYLKVLTATTVELYTTSALSTAVANNGTYVPSSGSFTANTTSTVNGTTFHLDSASAGSGGAISSDGAALTLGSTRDTFTSDTATSDGGAVYSADSAQLNVLDDNFGTTVANTGKGLDTAANGGAVYAAAGLANTATATFTTDTFTGDTATTDGGAIYNADAGLVLTGTNLFGSTVNHDMATSGGAVYTIGATSTITSANFTGNTAVNGGALYADSGSNTTANSTTFLSNSATGTGDGGAIYSVGTALTLGSTTATKDTFTTNSAATDGGAVYTTDATLTVESTFGGSTTLADKAAVSGGAIYSTAATGTVTGSTLSFDTAGSATNPTGTGGAIYLNGGVGSTFTVGTTTLTSNTGYDEGGAITSLGGAGSSLTLTTDTFTSDASTTGSGGTVNSGDGTLTVNGGSFATNKALGTGGGSGGAIYFTGGSLSVGATTAVTFTSDSAYLTGGAILFDGTTSLGVNLSTFGSDTVTDVPVSANTNGSGTAISNISTGTYAATITSSTFTTDIAKSYGGAYYGNGGVGTSLTLSTDKFTSDTASAGSGGAVYSGEQTFIDNGSTYTTDTATGVVVSGAFVAGSGLGGAIFSIGGSNTISIGQTTPDTFATCTASAGGGAIYFAGSSGNISGTFTSDTAKYTTAAENYSFGARICSKTSTSMSVTNSVFTLDTASEQGEPAIFSQDPTLTVNNCVFGNATSTGLGLTGTTGGDSALAGGGGIAYNVAGGTITVTNSQFLEDTVTNTTTAGDPGGGIEVGVPAGPSNAPPAVIPASFTAYGDTFYKDTATNAGAAVYTTAVINNISESTFTKNTAAKDYGGGIFADAGVATLNVYDTLFNANSAKIGGGIFFTGVTASIANDTFYDNVATGVTSGGVGYGGGGLALNGSGSGLTESVVADSTFYANEATLTKSGAGIDSGTGTVAIPTVKLEGDIVSQNTTGTTTTLHNDLAGIFDATSSYNIIGDGAGTSQVQTGFTADAGNITAATDATGLATITLTTGSVVGLTSGEQITVSGVQGNTAANGTFYAKVSGLTIALYTNAGLTTVVSGNGTYVTGTGSWSVGVATNHNNYVGNLGGLSAAAVFGATPTATALTALFGTATAPGGATWATGTLAVISGGDAFGTNDSASFPVINGIVGLNGSINVLSTDQTDSNARGLTDPSNDNIGAFN